MKSQKRVFIFLMLLSFILLTSKIISAGQSSNILSLGIKIQVDDSLVLRNIKNAKSAVFHERQKMKIKTENGPTLKGRLISANSDSIVLSNGTFNFAVDTKDVTKIIVPLSIEAQAAGIVVIGVGAYIMVVSGITVLWSVVAGLIEPISFWFIPAGLAGGAAGYGTIKLGSKIGNKIFNLKKNWQIQ